VYVDGSQPTRLGQTIESEGAFSWSPDGARIAFVSGDAGDHELQTIDADGTGERRLTQTGESEWSPIWAPTGDRIAFSRTAGDGSRSAILTINQDGTGEVCLTPDLPFAHQPAWSPDGARIAFASSQDPEESFSAIWVMNADGSEQRRLTAGKRPDDTPIWSRDGRRIAFRRWPDEDREMGCPTDLWVMGSDGSDQRLVASGASMPEWSPDGALMAYCTPSKAPSHEQVWVRGVLGGEPTQVSSGAHCYGPAWSPNGTRIAYFGWGPDTSYDLYTADPDGTERLRITEGPEDDQQPLWQPRVPPSTRDGAP
jgi:TolB protein